MWYIILGIFSIQKQSLLIGHIFIEMVLGCKWTIHFCTKCLDIRSLSCCWCKSITRCWLDFFDIISSPVYRFSKYQTETIGAFSLLFLLLPLMIERLTHQYHLSYKGQRVNLPFWLYNIGLDWPDRFMSSDF